MEILPKDDEIINKSSEISNLDFPKKKTEVLESIDEALPREKVEPVDAQSKQTEPKSVPKSQTTKPKINRPSRRSMITDIKADKKKIAKASSFRKGTAVELSTLYIRICNLNFTISNLKHLSDEEVYAIWKDIKLNK